MATFTTRELRIVIFLSFTCKPYLFSELYMVFSELVPELFACVSEPVPELFIVVPEPVSELFTFSPKFP